jgi:hypothetical protein|tara:strand:+ start:822 stop:1643 length:822 start_codon:yes stop_codon:yes gene_type:complete
MSIIVPYQLRLTGGLADRHRFEAYDGYSGMAGFARTLSLVSNYVETGKIRQRGDFEGRHSIIGTAPREGSVLTDFLIQLDDLPAHILGAGAIKLGSRELFNALLARVFSQNLGDGYADNRLEDALSSKRGDIETLVAITEAPIRQTHQVISAGVGKVNVVTGSRVIKTLDQSTKDYVNLDVRDDTVICKEVTVSAFNANSGYGSVFDFDLGRNVSFQMTRENLQKYRRVFSWGLDQYASRTPNRVHTCFTTINFMDGRAKRYQIVQASRIEKT